MVFESTSLGLVAIFALSLWLVQNFAHEGAHALAAKHWGATITELWPFPNKKLGHFTFAFVRFKYGDETPDATARGIISAAPQIANTLVLSILLGLRWRFPDMPDVVASGMAAWALVNFIDGAVNLSTFYRSTPKDGTDGWSWAKRFDLSPRACRGLTASWQAWFGFHLLIPPSLLG